MKLPGSILAISALVLLSGCAGLTRQSRPPTVSIPGVSYATERLRASDLTIRSAPMKEPAGTPTTILSFLNGDLHGMIRVRKLGDSIERDTIPAAPNAAAYLIARKAEKHYTWGEAHSCLAQFTQEAYGNAPNNHALNYQVAGTSSDGKFSVFCWFSVTHPKLPSQSKAKLYRGSEFRQLDRHPDMRLIEHTPDRDFRPRIDRIDGIINVLQMRE